MAGRPVGPLNLGVARLRRSHESSGVGGVRGHDREANGVRARSGRRAGKLGFGRTIGATAVAVPAKTSASEDGEALHARTGTASVASAISRTTSTISRFALKIRSWRSEPLPRDEDRADPLELALAAELARVRLEVAEGAAHELRDRHAVAPAGGEVHHRRLEPVARGKPLVLGREDPVVRRDLLAPVVLLRVVLDERLAEGGDRDRVLEPRDTRRRCGSRSCRAAGAGGCPTRCACSRRCSRCARAGRRPRRSRCSRGSGAAGPRAATPRRPSAGWRRGRSARRARTASSPRARAAGRGG